MNIHWIEQQESKANGIQVTAYFGELLDKQWLLEALKLVLSHTQITDGKLIVNEESNYKWPEEKKTAQS